MWFLPITMSEAVEAVRKAYKTAHEYATRVGGRVELLQPKHLYGVEKNYSLQSGKIAISLPQSSVVVLWGFYNRDESLEFVRFIQDNRLYEWFVKPIANYPSHVGVWMGDPLVFRNSLTIEIHAAGRDNVAGWPLGYITTPVVREERKTKRRR